MWLVKLSIAGETFVEAMEEVGLWLAAEGIDTSHFSCARDVRGSVRLRISFRSREEAERFARRFRGAVIPAEPLLSA